MSAHESDVLFIESTTLYLYKYCNLIHLMGFVEVTYQICGMAETITL
jgi:hypothetical protein